MNRDEIIDANPIADYVRNRGHALKRAGENFVTNACPKAQHKKFHRPVSIDPSKQLWHCNDCNVGGTVIDWEMVEKNISAADAMRALGGGRNGSFPKPTAIYDYTDETGKLLYQVCRFKPKDPRKKKDFKQRRPDGKGGWIWNTDGVRRILYNLPEVIKAQTVVITEGEKDADNLRFLGHVATTNPHGAEKWRDEYGETLRDKDVVIFGDADEKGQAHVEQVISSLGGIARSIKRVPVPDGFKDVSDYIASISPVAQRRIITNLIDSTPQIAISAPPTVRKNQSTGNVESQNCDASRKTNDSAQIRGRILEILRDGNLQRREQFALVAEAVTDALGARGQFFFHAEQKDFRSAMFFDNDRKRLELIQSDSFLAWLGDWISINRADPIFKFVEAQIETAALAGKQSVGIIPESFWAARKDAIYLSNGDGAMARITALKVDLVDNGTDGILFSAGATLELWNLTEPRDPFETCALFRDATYGAAHGKDLLRAIVLSIPTNPPSKPPPCLTGAVGSGKTRTPEGISILYGLPVVTNKVEDYGENDFWVSIEAGGLFTLDNADTRNRWLADAVASAATAGCSQVRKLYKDLNRVTRRARAWVFLTTANPTFANDAGLADRLLVVRMNRRTEGTSESSLFDEIREHRNAGLSFIAQSLAKALADHEKTPRDLNLRHPDFAAFCVRIGRAIGREQEIVAALHNAEMDKSLFCLENDTLGEALIAFMRNHDEWEGTAAELLAALKDADPEGDMAATKANGKPIWSAKRLGRRLGMLWPHLQKIFKAKQETGRGRITTYTFKNRQNGEFGESHSMFWQKSPASDVLGVYPK
jgi:5S rRNA maturation endonuclease (ribonuclease M5)